MKKITLALCIIILFISSVLFSSSTIFVYAQVNVNSSARSMIVLETVSKRIIYEKNALEQLPIASLTKIITALTVINNCGDLDQKVNIDDQAVGIGGTSIYLRKGEILTVRELLYGLMLSSGNDAAVALAIHIGTTLPKFCQLMNKTANDCGAKMSNFTNPHGLDDKEHRTCAYDIALITAKALENDVFREICSTKNIRISGNDEVEYRYLANKNKLLSSLDGCIGVKTGFTDDAGRCYVGAVKRNNMTLICVVLNCGPMFEECTHLLNNAFDNYKLYELLPENYIIKKIRVEKGINDRIKVGSKVSFSYPMSLDEFLKVDFQYELPEFLYAPIDKDKNIGKVKILLDNELLFSENIYTIEEVKSFKMSSGLKDIINKWTKG